MYCRPRSGNSFTRRTTIEPGGMIAIHRHDKRPDLVYILVVKLSNMVTTIPTSFCLSGKPGSTPELALTSKDVLDYIERVYDSVEWR
ncbi:hypothetical protein J2T55_001656 [Methylohalomonas lacus]|uniref:Uncharacterized protein n=1 Tax=Methylohalomonas lacus TaxID=398773 RepID=A0AAE3L5N5_9GAMM|nr:hypothetical protein [Methylohalomonas lacus]